MSRILSIIQSALLVFLSAQCAFGEEYFGEFKGEVVATFLADGRNMRLEQPFGYIDPLGVHWDAPAGTITDGASVPQIFWTMYPPFTGQYRAGAVIHDYFCQVRTRPWRYTHLMFYYAMLASRVPPSTAKVMYAAVYYFGPRWGIGVAPRGPGADKYVGLEEQERLVKELSAWVVRENPTIEEIERRLDTGSGPN